METPEDHRVAGWTQDRLAHLAPPDDWTPNLARNRARLGEQLTRQKTRRVPALIAAAAVVLLVSLGRVPVLRAVAERCGEWLLTVTNVSHAPVRPALPEFPVVDVHGQPVSLSTYRGKVVLLTVWTTTCGQCQTETSWFTAFQQAYRDRGFVVLGVAVDPEGWSRVTPFLNQRSISYQVVTGDRAAAQSAIGPSVPTTMILDRAGRIAVRHVGYCSKSEFQRDIQKVLAE